jgi:hypothetical protein
MSEMEKNMGKNKLKMRWRKYRRVNKDKVVLMPK